MKNTLNTSQTNNSQMTRSMYWAKRAQIHPNTRDKTIAQLKRQILRDFDQFARRMRLTYVFHGQDNEPHPFHVKSTWEPPIQRSVALESYLEEVNKRTRRPKTRKA